MKLRYSAYIINSVRLFSSDQLQFPLQYKFNWINFFVTRADIWRNPTHADEAEDFDYDYDDDDYLYEYPDGSIMDAAKGGDYNMITHPELEAEDIYKHKERTQIRNVTAHKNNVQLLLWYFLPGAT